MLKLMIVQEIQDLKQGGYSLNEVMDHLAARPGKTPSRATVRKYYDLDGVPEDLHARCAKLHALDAEPFRTDILDILALIDKLGVRRVEPDEVVMSPRLLGLDRRCESDT